MADLILGRIEADTNKFVIRDDALSILKSLSTSLDSDKNNGELRRSLLDNQIILQQIIPLFMAGRYEAQPEILETVVRILCKMTLPLGEGTLPFVMDSKEHETSYNVYLSKLKDLFNDSKTTWPIMKLLKTYTTSNSKRKDAEKDARICDCLKLVTNLLIIDECESSTSAAEVIASLQRPSKQFTFVWHLLYQNFDNILFSLISERQWAIEVSVIIKLMYQDIEPTKLMKSLHEYIMTVTISSSDQTYPSSPSRSRSCSSNEGVITHNVGASNVASTSKSTGHGEKKKETAHEVVKRTIAEGFRGDQGDKSKVINVLPARSLRLSEKSSKRSSTSLSDLSGTFTMNDVENVQTTAKRKHEDDDNDTHENKSIKLSLNQEKTTKKRKSKSARDKTYKDMGFSSGIGDQNSSESDPLEDQNWRVRVGDLSDHGYVSYLTDQIGKKSRKLLPFESLTEEEKREYRQKIIERRSKTMNNKVLSLQYYVVIEKDVMDILTDFTLDFLIKGYRILVSDLFSILSRTDESDPDRSSDCHKTIRLHYYWLLYFFLPIATKIEIPFNLVQATYEDFHYIAGETLRNAYELSLGHSASRPDNINNIISLVKAQRCLMEIFSNYEEMAYLKPTEKNTLKRVLLQIVRTENVRQMYVILIKLASFNYSLRSQFLEDLIVVNHIHLTKIQQLNVNFLETDMTVHIKQFAYPEMMRPYGLLLEKFQSNSAIMNDCIFTMMHHVAGDLVCPQALDIAPFPASINHISTKRIRLCDDWQDLIEYMMNYYRLKIRRACYGSKHEDSSTCSQEGSKNLALQASADKGSQISSAATLTKPSVCKSTQTDSPNSQTSNGHVSSDSSNQTMTNDKGVGTSHGQLTSKASPSVSRKEEVKLILGQLKNEKCVHLIKWLQKSLLQLWRVKYYLAPNQAASLDLVRNFVPLEPVPWNYARRVTDVPLIPYNYDLANNLNNQSFQTLLKKMGLLSSTTQPAIPISLSSHEVLELAVELGPVECKKLYPELFGECVV